LTTTRLSPIASVYRVESYAVISEQNREFIDKAVCFSAALCPTKMSEYPGVGGAWWLLYARNERKATVLSVSAQIRG
jgi:hypothetical protein